MNLLELATGAWNPKLLDATAPGLGQRLKPRRPERHRGRHDRPLLRRRSTASRPGTPVVAFTGDNPSSLVGMGATRPGAMVVSLGTSDTVFAAMAAPRTDPRGYGHVFGNPAGGFMALVCFANGSLAREEVARRLGSDWDAFARAILEQTSPGNGGNLLLPYFVPGDHAPAAGPRAALVRQRSVRRRAGIPRRRPAPWWRRRRSPCACTPPSSARRPTVSW